MELVGSLVFQMGRLFGYFGSGHFESICNCRFLCIFRGGIGSGLRVGEIILKVL